MKRLVLGVTAMLFLAACTPQAYTDNLKSGNEALQHGQYQEALTDYTKASKEKNTDEVSGLLVIAQSMVDSENALKEGDLEASIFALNKVMDQKSSDDLVTGLQKEVRAKLSDLKKAAALYDSLKTQDIKGQTLLDDQQFDQAIEVFKAISETNQYTEYIPIQKLKKQGLSELNRATDSKKSYEAELEKQQAANQQAQQPVQGAPQEAATQPPKQTEANAPLTHQQAVDLVRQYLNITSRPEVIAEYDHDNQKGDYVIHVYEIVIDNPQTKQGHTNTWGWYAVNKTTKAVYNALTN